MEIEFLSLSVFFFFFFRERERDIDVISRAWCCVSELLQKGEGGGVSLFFRSFFHFCAFCSLRRGLDVKSKYKRKNGTTLNLKNCKIYFNSFWIFLIVKSFLILIMRDLFKSKKVDGIRAGMGN